MIDVATITNAGAAGAASAAGAATCQGHLVER
jgi:hypothetical protein